MEIIKFGGKSLANGAGIRSVASILHDKIKTASTQIIIVVSARGNATNQLLGFLDQSTIGDLNDSDLASFLNEQLNGENEALLHKEYTLIKNTLQGVKLMGDYSQKSRDLLLAQGEIMAAKYVQQVLKANDIEAKFCDSRKIIKTNSSYGEAQVNHKFSQKLTQSFFTQFKGHKVFIVTGFIGSDEHDNTTTLGRNGSNYTASLIAKYMKANKVLSYTHVDGIYTANPDVVNDARVIDQLNFKEANEMASFGANILHRKTIKPLIDGGIPLHILNTFNPKSTGTYISKTNTKPEIKALVVKEDIALIHITGKGMKGKIGIDARLFNTLKNIKVNVNFISQSATETSVSFIISSAYQPQVLEALNEEFEAELKLKEIHKIYADATVGLITIIGQEVINLSGTISTLKRNQVQIKLISNTVQNNNISIIFDQSQVKKAANIIHSEIFGVPKSVNVAVFGKGTVGQPFINQILEAKDKILHKKNINLNIFAVAGTQNILLNKEGVGTNWSSAYHHAAKNQSGPSQIIEYANSHQLENLVAIDNTSSKELVSDYLTLVENGFDLVSSNKIANTNSFEHYQSLRTQLRANNKQYLYETNVGAGLPIIDTIRLLHESGENITRIKGVFSGSLSFIFNEFSSKPTTFSETLHKAMSNGYTEPDPREDLSGKDVARKLLILARELDLQNEMDDIRIENLIPTSLRDQPLDVFLDEINFYDAYFETLKQNQEEGHVLRYVGELSGDLSQDKGELNVRLVSVPQNSPLGNLKGADSIIEIFTESYGENPITIQGAGAGALVTARGVFGDLLRIAEKK